MLENPAERVARRNGARWHEGEVAYVFEGHVRRTP